MKRINIDEGLVKSLRQDGMSLQGIADVVGCSFSTVRRVLEEGGYIPNMHIVERETGKFPIPPEEIDRCRRGLQIGETVWMPEQDDWDQRQVRHGKYHVAEKYRWFCIVRNSRGRERSVLYVDLIIRERGKKTYEKDK